MGIKKQYMVNKNWEQGIKFGWDCYFAKDNGNLLRECDSDDPGIVSFVENKAPKLFEEFYQKIIGEIEKAGGDPDKAVEFCEELLGPSLGESLLWMAGWTNKELLEESD